MLNGRNELTKHKTPKKIKQNKKSKWENMP
jgi:hypothetical protein